MVVRSTIKKLVLGVATLFPLSGTAHSLEIESARFGGGLGYSWVNGTELVYNASGDKISELRWESNVLSLNANAEISFYDGWTLNFAGVTALEDAGYMVDYDWLPPYAMGYGINDWTDRSRHPDTRLGHYHNLSASLSRSVHNNEHSVFDVEGGFKFVNAKWTAYGGDFLYSDSDFRDFAGTFPDGQPGISYEQWMPTLFIGGNVEVKQGNFTVKIGVRAGATVDAHDEDFHFDRDLRFVEEYGPIPFAELVSEVEYQLKERISLTAGVDFQKFFRTKGDTTIYSISTGEQVAGPIIDGAGMDFTSIDLKFALRMTF